MEGGKRNKFVYLLRTHPVYYRHTSFDAISPKKTFSFPPPKRASTIPERTLSVCVTSDRCLQRPPYTGREMLVETQSETASS